MNVKCWMVLDKIPLFLFNTKMELDYQPDINWIYLVVRVGILGKCVTTQTKSKNNNNMYGRRIFAYLTSFAGGDPIVISWCFVPTNFARHKTFCARCTTIWIGCYIMLFCEDIFFISISIIQKHFGKKPKILIIINVCSLKITVKSCKWWM